MGFLFEGGSGTSSTKHNKYVREAAQKGVGIATGLADRPYQPYQGPRVAGRNVNQRAAARRAREAHPRSRSMIRQGFEQSRGVGGDARTAYRPAQQMTQAGFDLASDVGNNRWNAQQAGRYMNPFIESALDPTIRRLNEEAQQNAIAGRARMIQGGGVGAFGDARTAALEGEIEESRLRGIGDTLSQGYFTGYETARGAFEDEQRRRLGAAGEMGTLGGRYGELAGAGLADRLRAADLMGTQGGRYGAVTGAEISDLSQTGRSAQEQEQRNLDVAYEDFLEQRDWDAQGLDYIIRALSGTPSETTTKTQAPSPSVAQQVTGAGVAAAGLYSAFF